MKRGKKKAAFRDSLKNILNIMLLEHYTYTE